MVSGLQFILPIRAVNPLFLLRVLRAGTWPLSNAVVDVNC